MNEDRGERERDKQDHTEFSLYFEFVDLREFSMLFEHSEVQVMNNNN